MKDFVGNTLNKGDWVVYRTSGRYPTYKIVLVVDFTPKRVKVVDLISVPAFLESANQFGLRDYAVQPTSIIKPEMEPELLDKIRTVVPGDLAKQALGA